MPMLSHFLRRILPILLVFLLVFPTVTLAGCADSKDFTLYYGVSKAPQNLDPQLAAVDSELLFARNCFRGLYKLDENDRPVPDLVTDYTLSPDGLTYTFKLNGNKWSDGKDVTASDFRFALLRAADPTLNAPGVEYIRNIVGVNESLNGTGTYIGVSSPDSNTLIITLSQPDSNFLIKLTKPIFMPCNEAFFTKCGGKYGLSKEHILTNGNFKVSRWPNEKSIELQRVSEEKLNGTSVKKVVLSESQTGKLNSQRIIDKEIGITAVSGEDFTKINRKDYTVDVDYCKNYAICFNRSTDIGKNGKLLEAMAIGIDRVFIKQNMSERFKIAYSCIPEDSQVLEAAPLGDIGIKDYSFETEPSLSRSLFLDAVKSFKSGKLPTVEIICTDDPDIKAILTNAIYGWQSNLGVVVNIKTVATEQEALNLYKTGQYSVAFLPFNGSADEILNLVSDNVQSVEYQSIMTALNATDNVETAKSLVLSASDILSTEPSLIPIVSVPKATVHSTEYKDVYFSKIDGTVDFSIIYK
ncbi:MAG: hypothetical protein E7525_02990 [Ruminococcaceae bacterium]|nr:hypothetical protein [Oscillospiraceae bacterium]